MPHKPLHYERKVVHGRWRDINPDTGLPLSKKEKATRFRDQLRLKDEKGFKTPFGTWKAPFRESNRMPSKDRQNMLELSDVDPALYGSDKKYFTKYEAEQAMKADEAAVQKSQQGINADNAAEKKRVDNARAAESATLTQQNRINKAAESLKKADQDGEALEVQNDQVAEKTQELVNTARAEIKAAKENLKTNVFTRHYKTGKALGVMTKRQRDAYEKEAGTKTFESEMESYGLDPNDPRRETKYTSKSWRNREDQKRKELLIKQQEQTNKQEIQIGNNNKEKKE
jgi:hypothetical protein